ncbi:F-box/LRR-repeat protein 3 [Capsicum annuum]|uniref:F-box/LRR-repeat protein 3 n=1 Tax=Capsicum annuum TaxID=4072 RepID=A0A2G2YKP8_CAPAN|nr:F-box/LRR-repeat protein 3 [Capsicum annuum]KAF3636932.1 F-box/LRR-repeat protein 3 [Capsicum annuum]KAF3663535.1 F-box/LRR-repeat protein 3 [Capsicum annuum]PHT70320.1 F-box/LRR-repeat protein 3 [Capsicum annuum]
MKKQKQISQSNYNPFDFLSEEIVFSILDYLSDNQFDKKSFSLVCKSFFAIESYHRKTLKPFRPEHLTKILNRYPQITNLDLSLCPRITDGTLTVIASLCKEMLRSINLSKSKFFTHVGLSNLVMNCGNLVEIDLSNATELKDVGAAALAEARNLERLWLVRCKSITDIGLGCIAVGCRKLRLISLRWCLGVGDLGVGLIAVKCKEIRSLDLSYLPITNECLSSISKLQYLEDLVLEGCYGIDDDSLASLEQGCKSLEKLDMSSCQNVSHVGLSSLTSCAGCLRQLILAYGSPVTPAVADSLQKLSRLQSVKLDGCQVTCSGLQAIGNWCVSLKELSLSKCLGVTDEGLCSLVTKHKDLRKLDITCCRKITHVSISHIMNSCALLTSLRMESCTLVPREAFVLIGQRCQYLEELDLTDNEIDDEGLKSISKCVSLSSLKLGICLNITDQGLIHLGMSCVNLKELDLYRSAGISDLGLLAITRGCTGLEMINIAYCNQITDGSFISISKCSKLNTLESRGCPFVTSLGLAAVAVGCKQLTTLDIKKCQNIDDAGMIPLAHFSPNLKQINLSYTSVTDVGLLSLASISGLQNMTILHLKGLSPGGLGAALLACGGLTKVKLQTSFKSLLPQPLLQHLEARGCVFQWREKPFQAEVDPTCWKIQLDDLE